MKLGFVTCVQLGLSCMEAIYEVGGKLDFVMTLPNDKAVGKSGRVYVDEFCARHEIPLLKSTHVNNLDVIESIYAADIDWLFIIGWSQIASPSIVNSAKKGVFGMHPTLLPEGRGRASIPWAILKGLDKTGVTLFKMDAGVDTGPVAAQIEIPLTNNMSATELYEKVNKAHVQLIHKVIPLMLDDKLDLIPQDHSKATLWPGRKPEDGEIDLNGSVYDAEKLVRSVTHPYPGAFYFYNGIKHIVWSAKVGTDFDRYAHDDNCLRFKDGVLVIKEFDLQVVQQ